jgi:hypothetical protein
MLGFPTFSKCRASTSLSHLASPGFGKEYNDAWISSIGMIPNLSGHVQVSERPSREEYECSTGNGSSLSLSLSLSQTCDIAIATEVYNIPRVPSDRHCLRKLKWRRSAVCFLLWAPLLSLSIKRVLMVVERWSRGTG